MVPVNFNCATSSSVHESWRSSLLYARMDKFVWEKVYALRPINLFDLIRSSQHSMSSVTVYTHLCMMYLEVYTHIIHESSADVN